MSYLAVCLLCILGIELFIKLPFAPQIAALWRVSQKSVRVISSSKISDHWKEKALQRYSRDMALASLSIGLLLAVLAAVLGAAAFLVDLLITPETPTLELFMTVIGLVLAAVFSCVYIFVRKRLVAA